MAEVFMVNVFMMVAAVVVWIGAIVLDKTLSAGYDIKTKAGK